MGTVRRSSASGLRLMRYFWHDRWRTAIQRVGVSKLAPVSAPPLDTLGEGRGGMLFGLACVTRDDTEGRREKM